MNGGVLEFDMTNIPNKNIVLTKEDMPYSYSDGNN